MKTYLSKSLAGVAALLVAFHAAAAPWVSRHDMTATEYQDEFNKWTANPYNYRLISVCGYEKAGQPTYAAIWEEQSGPGWITHPQMTKAQFDALSADYADDDLYPVFISGFGVGGQAYYNAIWEHLPGADIVAKVGLTHANYVSQNSTYTTLGYKLVHLWTFNAGPNEYFTAVWRKGVAPDYTAATQLTPAQYQTQFNNLTGQGYQLVVVSAAVIGGNARYAGVWRKPGNGSSWYTQHDLSEVNYQAQSWNWYYQGYRPVLASVHTTAAGRRFNMIVHRNGGMAPANLQTVNNAVQDYMDDNDIPGLSLAISRNGQLVFAKGFGQANQAADEWVHPQHRFRIASVSKPITGAAVLRLRDHCGLDLDETVFGPNGILGNSFGTPPYSNRERAITVRQLLQHTTGWTNDGIWKVAGSNPNDAVDWQLDNALGEPMYVPGTWYDYMNIGFCVAGRVIERRIGKSYEQFCKDELFAPSCVTEMEIGGGTLAERKPGEVVYYANGDDPYSLSPSRMDAHGGWIAKPLDLLLFLRRIDGDAAQADLLQPDSLTEMLTGSTPNSGYGLGAGVSSAGWGHNGAMPGTLALLEYRNDGLAFAVTCNIWPSGTDKFASALKTTINNLIDTLDAANAWPNYDLFPCDIPSGPAPRGLADPRHFYVDNTANCLFQTGQKTCSFLAGPFSTIIQAINTSCSGDAVFIRAGSYNETLTFNKLMTVRSYDGIAIIGK